MTNTSKHKAPEDCEYYMCGPPMMISSALKCSIRSVLSATASSSMISAADPPFSAFAKRLSEWGNLFRQKNGFSPSIFISEVPFGPLPDTNVAPSRIRR